MSMQIQAAVARIPHGSLCVETLTLAAPTADEVLVRLVATGICHSDISVIDQILPLPLPLVLGHEGAGIVEQIGGNVRGLAPGDHVVLTFASCGRCSYCADDHPAYCDHYMQMNFAPVRSDGSDTITDAAGQPVGATFFRQSSFATYALASQRNTVKVRKDAPLELLGPLACGFSTGAGTVLNVLQPKPRHVLAVVGAGALGCAAIMAATYLGVKTIIAVDRVARRLDVARALGAATTIDTSSQDITQAFAAIGGIDFVIDTSGVPKLIEASVNALKVCGKCVLLGAGTETNLRLSVLPMVMGRTLMGVVNGDCDPSTLIPRLVDMYLAGDFPIDALTGFYGLDQINEAIEDSRCGKTIKPIIRF